MLYRDNFVITEDDYIGYLSRNPVETFVPMQILGKLRTATCSSSATPCATGICGSSSSRIWQDDRMRARSWAVQRSFSKSRLGLLGVSRRRRHRVIARAVR